MHPLLHPFCVHPLCIPFCTLSACTPFATIPAPSLIPETRIKRGITDGEKKKGVHRECGEMWSICTQKSKEK